MQPPPGIAPYLDDLHQLIHSTFSGKQRLQQHQKTFVKNARHLPNTRHTLSLNSFRLNTCQLGLPPATLSNTHSCHKHSPPHACVHTHTKHVLTPVTTARSVPVRVEARPSHNPSTICQWRSCTRLLQISAQEHGSTANRCTRCSALLSPAQQLLLSPHTNHTPCAPCPLAINNLRLPVHHTIPTGPNTPHPYPTTSLPSLANHNKRPSVITTSKMRTEPSPHQNFRASKVAQLQLMRVRVHLHTNPTSVTPPHQATTTTNSCAPNRTMPTKTHPNPYVPAGSAA